MLSLYIPLIQILLVLQTDFDTKNMENCFRYFFTSSSSYASFQRWVPSFVSTNQSIRFLLHFIGFWHITTWGCCVVFRSIFITILRNVNGTFCFAKWHGGLAKKKFHLILMQSGKFYAGIVTITVHLFQKHYTRYVLHVGNYIAFV